MSTPSRLAVVAWLATASCHDDGGSFATSAPSSVASAAVVRPAPPPSFDGGLFAGKPEPHFSPRMDPAENAHDFVVAYGMALNAGDRNRLARLYASSVVFRGRPRPNAEVVRYKLEPHTRQQIAQLQPEFRPDGSVVALVVTSARTGGTWSEHDRAYILARKVEGALRVVEEGDFFTDDAHRAIADTAAQRSPVESTFTCPGCTQPHSTGPAPPAYPSLGPPTTFAVDEPPPGAPSELEWARLVLDRFASAADVPLFASVSPLSVTGDGRTFFHEFQHGAWPRRAMECSVGGAKWTGSRQPGTPDARHHPSSRVTSAEELRRDADKVRFSRSLYSPDGIENFVRCTIDPTYEGYFLDIARRTGASLRALPGGWYRR